MDKALQREQIRERVKRYRERQSVTKGEEQSVTEYRPIILALADPVKREKLQRICHSLSGRSTGKKNRLGDVYYGMGIDSTSFLEVDELLQAF